MILADSRQFAIRRSLLPVFSRFGDRSYQFFRDSEIAPTSFFAIRRSLLPVFSRFGDRSYQFYLHISTKYLHTQRNGSMEDWKIGSGFDVL